jgi:hypothetical protein
VSDTLAAIQRLVASGDVLISAHGYDELAADDILAGEALGGVAAARLIEDYPDFSKGPSCLVLQQDRAGRPIHVVWGIPRGAVRPAVLVTAYRPDPARWTADFSKRKAVEP